MLFCSATIRHDLFMNIVPRDRGGQNTGVGHHVPHPSKKGTANDEAFGHDEACVILRGRKLCIINLDALWSNLAIREEVFD